MKPAVIRVYNAPDDFGTKAILEDYDTLIYRRRWRSYNEFQITFPYYTKDITRGNVIVLDDNPRKNGLVEFVQMDENEGTTLIKGYSLSWLFSHRITVPPSGNDHLVVNSNAEDNMLALVLACCGSTAAQNRRYPGLTLPASQSRGDTIRVESRYKKLLDELTSLSEASGLGFGVDYNYTDHTLDFKIRSGKDEDQTPIISPKYDSALHRLRTIDGSSVVTTPYVGGQGEGAERAVRINHDNLTGFDRREIFVDARDLSDASKLIERGNASIVDVTNSYECDTTTAGYQEEDGWDLGDEVMIQDDEMLDDIIIRQITEVEEAYDSTGITITPTYGDPVKTLAALFGRVVCYE